MSNSCSVLVCVQGELSAGGSPCPGPAAALGQSHNTAGGMSWDRVLQRSVNVLESEAEPLVHQHVCFKPELPNFSWEGFGGYLQC